MVNVEVVDMIPSHIRDIASKMQSQSTEMAFRLGISPQKALWRSYKSSILCKTAFIDGRIAACWGVGGVPLSSVGKPWLILSPEVNDYPFKVAFMYRREVQRMQSVFPVLEDFVEETHEKAIRMLELMGFTIGKEKKVINGVTMLRAERKA